jgi:hypothetical protein
LTAAVKTEAGALQRPSACAHAHVTHMHTLSHTHSLSPPHTPPPHTHIATTRGLFELGEYSFLAVYRDSYGMKFSNLSDPKNGLVAVYIILALEWWVFMGLAWYLEQVRGWRGGVVRVAERVREGAEGAAGCEGCGVGFGCRDMIQCPARFAPLTSNTSVLH